MNKNSSLNWWLKPSVAIILKYYDFSTIQETWSSSLEIST